MIYSDIETESDFLLVLTSFLTICGIQFCKGNFGVCYCFNIFCNRIDLRFVYIQPLILQHKLAVSTENLKI